MNLPRSAVFGVLIVLVGHFVFAAEPKKKRPGRFKLGPLYLTPRFALQNAGVDTNVFNSQARPTPDFSVPLSSILDGALPVGQRLRLTGSGNVDFTYFRRRRTEQSVDFGGQGRAELDLGPFTFFGGAGGRQGKQRFTFDIDQRLLNQRRWAEAGLRFSLTRRFSAVASGRQERITFESLVVRGEDIKGALDRDPLTGTVELRYDITGKTGLLLKLDGNEDRFLRPSGAASRRVRSHRYLGGFELGERALIHGTILAGLREFPGTTSEAAPAYRGPALRVDASLPFLGSGRLSVLAERDVAYALNRSRILGSHFRNAYVSGRYRGELSLGLPFDLIGRGFGEFQQANYILPYLQGLVAARRVDHLWMTGGSLLRRLGGARVGGTVFWLRRVSNFDGFSFQGLRYGLQVELAP